MCIYRERVGCMCLCSLYMVPVPVVVILIGVVLLPKLYKHGGSQIQGWLARRPARFFKKKNRRAGRLKGSGRPFFVFYS